MIALLCSYILIIFVGLVRVLSILLIEELLPDDGSDCASDDEANDQILPRFSKSAFAAAEGPHVRSLEENDA